MIERIIKRDGREVPFEIDKISTAIYKAAEAIGGHNRGVAEELAKQVEDYIEKEEKISTPTVEHIQDVVERTLIESGHSRTAKEYILYRADRTRHREMNTRLMKIYEDLTFKAAKDNDIKRENANIDGDTAMGTMLKYGSEGAKQFYEMYILDPAHAKAHREGDIHIHDLDFLTLTTLCRKIDLVIDQLLDRFELQAQKKARNYPFLMQQGIWLDSDNLKPDDEVREVLKHGTLTMGFIGLAETLKALTGYHHGESKEAQNLGLEIVGYMRQRMDQATKKHGMNFSLIATPAEGLSGRFVRMDAEKFGKIPGVTDREYYTNSFHIPVYYDISAWDKIKLEAPYHALTNGGHISYVELDGDPTENLDAFEQVVRCMKESGIGYGSINHPVDRDPVCGYTGIIGDTCPLCGRSEHDGHENFERIRRITGYLVGTVDRFNNAKKAEVRDRVKHSLGTGCGTMEQV